MRRVLAMAALLCFSTGTASAQLIGTQIDIFHTFRGLFATQTQGPHTYGGSPTIYPDPGFPQFTWTASSPAGQAGFDNSVKFDYTNFALTDFAGTISTAELTNIAVAVKPGSAKLFTSTNVSFGTVMTEPNAIKMSFPIDTILATPNLFVHVAWDNESAGCYPDCDGNGQLNIDDFICFQLKFALQDPYADCDGNQTFNIDDFICFQLAFALGC